jgi:hypothetical protein
MQEELANRRQEMVKQSEKQKPIPTLDNTRLLSLND